MRECGTCSACCRWPEIPELQKPRGVSCPYLASCGFGCTAYENRPRSCSDYKCSWIEGYGGPDDRPDDCGVMVDRRQTPYGVVLIARDLDRKTPETKKRAIDRIACDLNLPCLLVANDDPEKIVFMRGPKKAMAGLVARRPELAALI